MPGHITEVNHDAFSRTSLMRETVHTKDTCAWCGSNNQGHLFRYFPVKDDANGRVNIFHRHYGEKLFCSKSCFEAYNG